MARSREGSPEAPAATLSSLPCVVIEHLLTHLPLRHVAQAACVCKALRAAAAAAAARVERLACADDWGVEQPSADAVAFAARVCTRLQRIWLGAGAHDDHLFALRRCVPLFPAGRRSPRWRQKPLQCIVSAAPARRA